MEARVYRYVNARLNREDSNAGVLGTYDAGKEIAEFLLMSGLIDDVSYNDITEFMDELTNDYITKIKG